MRAGRSFLLHISAYPHHGGAHCPQMCAKDRIKKHQVKNKKIKTSNNNNNTSLHAADRDMKSFVLHIFFLQTPREDTSF